MGIGVQKPCGMERLVALFGAACLVATLAEAQTRPTEQLREVRVNGVTLNYVDRGSGPAVVLVHGSVEDYRAWEAQVEPLAQRFHVVAYSRRYNFPNHNALSSDQHSAAVEAEDLAALIRKLHLAPAHVVGHSYGAYTALLLAHQHPELVRSLVLSEPPLLRWLPDLPGGQALLGDFMDNVWKPAAQAFRANDNEKALQVTTDWFGAHQSPTVGEPVGYATLPPEAHRYMLENLLEWRALTTSRDAFPPLARKEAGKIRLPALVMAGDHSLELLKLIAEELERVLPNARRVVLPGATHEMWNEFPEACRQILFSFLSKH
jgi:pimeloyl-ACP methyl ester carboxylesterase